MISAITTFCMILVFLMSGRILEAIKRLLMLIVDIILRILNVFGIRLSRTERRLKMSKEFKDAHKDIQIVKKSKENNKLKQSINIPAFCITIVCLCLIICNAVWPGCITSWVWEHNPLPTLLTSASSLEITFTALTFSIMSFSISMLISQWKETKRDREAKR